MNMEDINPHISTPLDYPLWLSLAEEVEPLFGPMVEDPQFQDGLKRALLGGYAICVMKKEPASLLGGIIFDRLENEILWLAVRSANRKAGIGRLLLQEAINRLDAHRPIRVQTYDPSFPSGLPARKLYLDFGFKDIRSGRPNPAGIPTVIMEKPASQTPLS